MALDKFAVFILTHGRPSRVLTYRTLRRQGYTGVIYLIVDNEDTTLPQYRALYGDQVIVFDKTAISQTFDEMDNFEDRRAVVYARNACFEIARRLGLEHFLQLDDDYTDFRYKFTSNFIYTHRRLVHSLDRLFSIILEFYKTIPALSIAVAQGGDFLGGKESGDARLWLKRKAMNSFFCSVQRPFTFIGRINEDVNTYISLGNRGSLFFTLYNTALQQETTQQHIGGMSELYQTNGTYRKSFYTVMLVPSAIKIKFRFNIHKRIHHFIDWPKVVPCILAEQYRKVESNGNGTPQDG